RAQSAGISTRLTSGDTELGKPRFFGYLLSTRCPSDFAPRTLSHRLARRKGLEPLQRCLPSKVRMGGLPQFARPADVGGEGLTSRERTDRARRFSGIGARRFSH